nr:hypothetical protein [uncultured Flavobacterium sp.]
MSEIQEYKVNPFNEKRIGFKAIKDLNSESIIMHELCDIIQLSHFEITTNTEKLTKEMLFLQAQALRNELKGKFEALTLPEVKEAFRLGIRGEAGQYFGMCAKTYHQFIKWYFELPERGKAWTAHLDYERSKVQAEKPVWYTPEFYRNAAINAFKDYKESGRMPYTAAAMYNVIKEHLGVETLILKEDWKQIQIEAQRSYEFKLKDESIKRGNIPKKHDLDFSIENPSFKNEAMKHGLRYYFDRLIKEGKELTFETNNG